MKAADYKLKIISLIIIGYVLYGIGGYGIAFAYNNLNHKMGHIWSQRGPHVFMILAPIAIIYSYLIIYSIRKNMKALRVISISSLISFIAIGLIGVILMHIKAIKEIPYTMAEITLLIIPLLIGSIIGYMIGALSYRRTEMQELEISKQAYKNIKRLYKAKEGNKKKEEKQLTRIKYIECEICGEVNKSTDTRCSKCNQLLK